MKLSFDINKEKKIIWITAVLFGILSAGVWHEYRAGYPYIPVIAIVLIGLYCYANWRLMRVAALEINAKGNVLTIRYANYFGRQKSEALPISALQCVLDHRHISKYRKGYVLEIKDEQGKILHKVEKGTDSVEAHQLRAFYEQYNKYIRSRKRG